MEPIELARLSLLVHAALGAVDTFYNHEWVERLPKRREAHHELRLHAWRSLAFVGLFMGAAWFEWSGALWIVLPLLVTLEYAITLVDSVEEDRYRRLKPFERVNHMLLALNTGCYATLITWQAVAIWRVGRTALVPAASGVIGWLLTLAAAGVAAWTIRDALAARALRKTTSAPTNSPQRAG
jgi:hypothetical protein